MPKRKSPDEPAGDAAHESNPDTNKATATATAPARQERQPGDDSESPKRKFAPDPFGVASDYLAGVHLRHSRGNRRVEIAFDEKPPQEVIDKLKENGYRYSSHDKVWMKPLHEDNAMRVRIEAERLYKETADMVRQNKGIATGQSVRF
jgi:hypothetical protein